LPPRMVFFDLFCGFFLASLFAGVHEYGECVPLLFRCLDPHPCVLDCFRGEYSDPPLAQSTTSPPEFVAILLVTPFLLMFSRRFPFLFLPLWAVLPSAGLEGDPLFRDGLLVLSEFSSDEMRIYPVYTTYSPVHNVNGCKQSSLSLLFLTRYLRHWLDVGCSGKMTPFCQRPFESVVHSSVAPYSFPGFIDWRFETVFVFDGMNVWGF